MIDTYNTVVRDLSFKNKEMLDLIDYTSTISEIPNPNSSESQLICKNIAKELEKSTLRIGVVGTIKSGKSTLVNSIFGKDYLKRGAGVLTSMVTRVRNSYHDQATLFFKTWEKINKDIKRSIGFLPYTYKYLNNNFDIRRQKDREDLKIILNSHDNTIMDNICDKNYTLLLSYLEGYQEINSYISTRSEKIRFTGKEFLSHHDFVTSDRLSVYLTDALLEINSENMKGGVEIADCQGSDSLNPLHLSMIQNYLNIAHLIVYVVSSKTGIRKADIEFLLLIKSMGILNNTLFVINTDLEKHDSIEDIKRITSETERNLSLICKAHYQVFTFSALRNLILSSNSDEPVSSSETISTFVDNEYKSFLNILKNKLNSDKYFLLISNHVHKLEVISKNIKSWAKLSKSILEKNTEESKKIIREMDKSHSELLNIKTTVFGSVKGSAQQIKEELFLNTDRFFGDKYQGIISNIIQFIREWEFSFDDQDKNTTKILYKVFQELKRAVEKYIYKEINPIIIRFVHEQENRLVQHFESLSSLYSSMFTDVAEKYNAKTKDLNLCINFKPSAIQVNLSLRNPLNLLSISFSELSYPKGIKIKAIIYSNFMFAIQRLLRIVNVYILKDQNIHKAAIERAIEKIKKDMLSSIMSCLKSYKENTKFQYMRYIVEMISKDIEQQISNQTSMNTMELSKMGQLVNSENKNKEKILKTLSDITDKSTKIEKEVNRIKLIVNKIKGMKKQVYLD